MDAAYPGTGPYWRCRSWPCSRSDRQDIERRSCRSWPCLYRPRSCAAWACRSRRYCGTAPRGRHAAPEAKEQTEGQPAAESLPTAETAISPKNLASNYPLSIIFAGSSDRNELFYSDVLVNHPGAVAEETLGTGKFVTIDPFTTDRRRTLPAAEGGNVNESLTMQLSSPEKAAGPNQPKLKKAKTSRQNQSQHTSLTNSTPASRTPSMVMNP